VPKRIEECFKQGKPIQEGLTNDVRMTENGTVIERYSRYPITSLYVSLVSLLGGRLEYIDRSKRIENEREAAEFINERTSINAPGIIGSEGHYVEYEKVTGVSCFQRLSSSGREEAEDLGTSIGRFISEVHSQNVALRDLRLENFVLSDGEIYSIDHEYSVFNSGETDSLVDTVTLLSSARQNPNFASFMSGFSEECEIGFLAYTGSAITSILDSAMLQRDLGRFQNAVRNIPR